MGSVHGIARQRARRRQERAKASLRESAKRAFEQHGYAKATVQHILGAAEVTRRTFYRYFTSKDDVFGDLLESLVADLRASVDIASDEPSLRERLRVRTRAFFNAGADNRAFLRAVDEAIRVNEDHARRWSALRAALDAAHRAALDWCIAHGIMNHANTALLARILSGIATSALLDLGRMGPDDPETVEATMAELYWNMLFHPHEGAEDYLLSGRRPRPVFQRKHAASR